MGLLDWASETRKKPGIGGGLLGGQWNADPGKSDDVRKALLMASLGMMSGQGNFWEGLGRAGIAGMGAYDNAQRQRRDTATDDFYLQQQKTQADRAAREDARQQALRSLPGQFMSPGGGPAMDPIGGMETAPETPANVARPQGFDTKGYTQALMGIDPLAALQFEAANRKDTSPIKLGEGDQLLDPKTFQPVATNPKAAPDKTPEALRALEAIYGKGSPEYMKAARDYAVKLTSHAPAASTTVTMGQPVAVTLPDGTQALVQPSNRAGSPPQIMRIPGTEEPLRPPPKDVPASTKEKLAENAVALQKIDAALALVEERPKGLGAKNYAGDTIMQRLDPEGVDVRAAVADIGSQKIHDRSGAAVTAAEAPRLKPFVPLATDTPETVKKKLTRFKSEYEAMQRELQAGAGIRETAGKAGPAAKSAAPRTTTSMANLSAQEAAELAALRKRFGKP